MISQETKDYVSKTWPDAENNEILLRKIKEKILQFAYSLSTPPNTDETFLEKAEKRARTMKFLANTAGVLVAIAFIYDVRDMTWIDAIGLYGVGLGGAFAIRYPYREALKLINCYKEILEESSKANIGQDSAATDNT
jgi:hypothetical protein